MLVTGNHSNILVSRTTPPPGRPPGTTCSEKPGDVTKSSRTSSSTTRTSSFLPHGAAGTLNGIKLVRTLTAPGECRGRPPPWPCCTQLSPGGSGGGTTAEILRREVPGGLCGPGGDTGAHEAAGPLVSRRRRKPEGGLETPRCLSLACATLPLTPRRLRGEPGRQPPEPPAPRWSPVPRLWSPTGFLLKPSGVLGAEGIGRQVRRSPVLRFLPLGVFRKGPAGPAVGKSLGIGNGPS